MFRPISRRTLLRGAGATLALPWLETMAPAADTAGANTLTEPPLRMAFLFIPNGTATRDTMTQNTDRGSGAHAWHFTTGQFRRTLAWHIAHQPFGIVAGASTETYARRAAIRLSRRPDHIGRSECRKVSEGSGGGCASEPLSARQGSIHYLLFLGASYNVVEPLCISSARSNSG